jgi:hypothetical protein
MANHRSFGRRGNPPSSSGRSMGTTETVAQATRVQSTGASIERPVRLSEKTSSLRPMTNCDNGSLHANETSRFHGVRFR